MSKPTASFNSNDLATIVPGLIIIGLPKRFPNRALTVGQVANSDKSVMSSDFYKDKKINVVAEIGRNTRELLDDAEDILYSILQAEEAALVLSWGSGGSRQWTATLSNVTVSDVQGGHATYDIEFEASDPIGVDVNSTSLFSTALTGSSSTTNFVIGGSASWQQPVITITLSALTGGTGASIVVGNPANGQQVTITGNRVAGDVVVIDSKLKKVTVNGTEVAFTGGIPEWAAPTNGAASVAGSMSYSDTLTTRTRSMVATYQKRWI